MKFVRMPPGGGRTAATPISGTRVITPSAGSVAARPPFTPVIGGLADPRMLVVGPANGSDDFTVRVEGLKEGFSARDGNLIQRAYEFAQHAHEGQIRRSGEPHVSHTIAVAEIVKNHYGVMDAVWIAAEILHDVIEDTKVTLEILIVEFGPEVARLVDGQTKLSRAVADENRMAENLKKLIAAMVDDPRIALGKVADSLHNMRDQHRFSPIIAREHAREAMAYAQLAGIFRAWGIQVELEGLALPWLVPDLQPVRETYDAHLAAQEQAVIAPYIERLRRDLLIARVRKLQFAGLTADPAFSRHMIWRLLLKDGIIDNSGELQPAFTGKLASLTLSEPLPDFVQGAVFAILREAAQARVHAEIKQQARPFAAAVQEITEEGMTLEQRLGINPLWLNNLLVVVNSPTEIQRVIDAFKAQSGVPWFRDIVNYYVVSKPNGYKAIRLRVPRPRQGILTVVLVDREQYERNQFGLICDLRELAQRRLRAGGTPPPGRRRAVMSEAGQWAALLAAHLTTAYAASDEAVREAIESFSYSFYATTPLGRRIRLPLGASFIDFAYGVHTELGRTAVSATVDDNTGLRTEVSIYETVQPGAVIHIDQSAEGQITIRPLWLSHARLPKAINDIKEYLQHLPPAEQIRLAREDMDAFSAQFHTTWEAAKKVSFIGEIITHIREKHGLIGCDTVEDLEKCIGRGLIDPVAAGNGYNEVYRAKIKERVSNGKLTPFVVRVKINQDQQGIIAALSREIAALKINISPGIFYVDKDGSATDVMALSVASSVQQDQVVNIINKFLNRKEVGGGRIERTETWERGKEIRIIDLMLFARDSHWPNWLRGLVLFLLVWLKRAPRPSVRTPEF